MNDDVVENVVASAATNGVIITWDLNKPGRNKQGPVHPNTYNL